MKINLNEMHAVIINGVFYVLDDTCIGYTTSQNTSVIIQIRHIKLKKK